jgi:3-hydroxybutyrate dehydrogenase
MCTIVADLEGKVAAVTGAAGGIGRSICDVLREHGAQVLAVDLAGDDVFHADIGTEEGNRAMIDTAVERHGALDILVLNAGVQHDAPIDEFPVEEWDRLLDAMLKGPFLAIKHGWAQLTRQPGGRIVATSSGSAVFAEVNKAAYVSAKHGVWGLIKVAALEGAPHGLTANAVGPGWVRTPMAEKQIAARMEASGRGEDEVVADMVARHPVKRFVETREVAEVIAFLASPAASGISGELVSVDLAASVNW